MGYLDANWGGDDDTSRSTSGYVFMACGGAIGWSSKRQTLVAMSSMESEYIGLSNAGLHLSWLHMFFKDIGHPQVVGCNNQSAIIVTKDPEYCTHTRHIQHKFHHIQDNVVGKGLAVIKYVPTSEMVTAIFTKALGCEKHLKFTFAMGLQPHLSGSVKI